MTKKTKKIPQKSIQVVTLDNGKCFKVSGRMTDKMDNIRSLNTSLTLNENCQQNRSIKNSICKHCYSYGSEKRYKNSHAMWALNYNTLSKQVLKNSEIPVFTKDEIFRFNAHGDLVNRTHYNNLIKIAKKNPDVKFAIWTKNLDVVFSGKGLIELDNLTHVYSDLFLNNLDDIELPDGFDKVFRVYDTKTLRENKHIKVNCKKSCFDCQLCYRKNKITVIIEKIKSSSK